ncbi:MAG: hypothetical protein MI863_13535 [Desulfobacterales bacterium]|nr:hypothetical protein [Desulfobacterales bacterium]
MGIFSGVEILFFFLGMLTAAGIAGLAALKLKYAAGWKTLSMCAAGLALVLFTIAWSVSSILEREHQAANMGVVFFGLPGILLLGMALKQIFTKKVAE